MGGEKYKPTDEAAPGKMDRAVLVGDEGETFVVVERDEVVGSSPTVVEPQQHLTDATSTPTPFVPEAFQAIG